VRPDAGGHYFVGFWLGAILACGRRGLSRTAAGGRCRGQEGRSELLVEGEEKFDAFAVGGEGLGAVAALDGAVETLVGFGEFVWHEERVVELGEGRVWIEGAGIEDGLG